MNDFIINYLTGCFDKKNGVYIKNAIDSLIKCADYFSPNFVENTLLPKLHAAVRAKSGPLYSLMSLIVALLSRGCISLAAGYVSKVNVELCKSNRSHER